jgi:heterotetrameric sarcosine oxidase gamma subunit
MADLSSVPRKSALDGHAPTGLFGAVKDGAPGIVISERRGLAIVHVDAWTDRRDDCLAGLKRLTGADVPGNVKATEAGGTACLWVGPDRWLVTEPETRDLYAAARADLSEDVAAVTDQGHSRVCWRVTGPALRDLLAKGSSIDFDPGFFGPGDCVGTQLGHVTVTIHCREETSVDIYAARSFAVDLHHWLTASSMEFGLRVNDPI